MFNTVKRWGDRQVAARARSACRRSPSTFPCMWLQSPRAQTARLGRTCHITALPCLVVIINGRGLASSGCHDSIGVQRPSAGLMAEHVDLLGRLEAAIDEEAAEDNTKKIADLIVEILQVPWQRCPCAQRSAACLCLARSRCALRPRPSYAPLAPRCRGRTHLLHPDASPHCHAASRTDCWATAPFQAMRGPSSPQQQGAAWGGGTAQTSGPTALPTRWRATSPRAWRMHGCVHGALAG